MGADTHIEREKNEEANNLMKQFIHSIHSKIIETQQRRYGPEFMSFNLDINDMAKETVEEKTDKFYMFPIAVSVQTTIDAGLRYDILFYLAVCVGLVGFGYQSFLDGLYGHAVLLALAVYAIIKILADRFELAHELGALYMYTGYQQFSKELLFHRRGYEAFKKQERDINKELSDNINGVENNNDDEY